MVFLSSVSYFATYQTGGVSHRHSWPVSDNLGLAIGI